MVDKHSCSVDISVSHVPSIRINTDNAATNQPISPVLLTRARSLANEYQRLSQQLADTYDAPTARKLGELSSTVTRLKAYDDAVSNLDNLVSMYGEDKEMDQAIDEEREGVQDQLSKIGQALVQSLVPSHPFAHLPCLLEIRPGAGGDEAGLFAGDLLRMYEAYCSRHGYSTSLLKCETSDGIASSSGGNVHLQEAVLEIDAVDAYDLLRCEAGVHRVQRVPATESKGRTHTSAASVLVLPSLPAQIGQELGEESYNDPESDYYIDTKDVRTDIMRARGAGGQHVNTTDSAVRLTHIPTGTVVAIQDSRSQIKNREKAWQLLRSRLAQQKREEREAEVARVRRGAGAGKVGRENKVRTYNWGQQRVTDHRSGYEVRRLDEVMEGGEALDGVMGSVRAWLLEQEVVALEHEQQT